MKHKGQFAVMCALSLALAACGGNGSSATSSSTSSASSSASSSTTSTNTSSSSSTAEKTKATTPVGIWRIAAVEAEGVTMTGDFMQLATLFGAGEATSELTDLAIELKEDGTGSFKTSSESYNLKWEESAGKINMTGDGSEKAIKSDMTGNFEDGVLKFNQDGTILVLTPDGTYADAKTYDISAAKAITSESELVGTWKLTGACMFGITMQGDSESLAGTFGYDAATVIFSAGGKVVLFGEETTYTVDANGAKVKEIDDSGTMIDLHMLDGELVLDLGSSMGAEGVFMVFSK